MNTPSTSDAPALAMGFARRVSVGDSAARVWLAEVTLRLRREVAWLWHERGVLHGLDGSGSALPPMIDPLHEALDINRYDGERDAFFTADPTAAYLTERIAGLARPGGQSPRGGFGWLAAELRLSPAECFVLALGLGGTVDSARGAVIAACQSAPSIRYWPCTYRVLGIGQRLRQQ